MGAADGSGTRDKLPAHGSGGTVPGLQRNQARMIPVLDVSDYLAGDASALDRLGPQLRHAFENVGFWYLRGHGVPKSLIDAMFAECKRFHAQPLEDKLALRINQHNIGYMPMGGSIARSSKVNNNTKASVNEAFFLRRERTPD